jgi:hypothetical protein
MSTSLGKEPQDINERHRKHTRGVEVPISTHIAHAYVHQAGALSRVLTTTQFLLDLSIIYIPHITPVHHLPIL